jgi:glucose-1-phosphate cytidylyltransferase
LNSTRVARAAAKYLGNAAEVRISDAVAIGHCEVLRFGELKLDSDEVVEFAEKPDLADTWINGGYFFFKREALTYLSDDDACVLERAPLVKLARDRQLSICKHRGFWYAMDTQRDREYLEELWKSGKAPWQAT